jgi:hypothetical protein
MIIGAIIEVGNSPVNPGGAGQNGAALFHFYTMREALDWAILQSAGFTVGATTTVCLTSVINTDDSTRRWWYDGTEQTG